MTQMAIGGTRAGEQLTFDSGTAVARPRDRAIRVRSLECQYTLLGPAIDTVLVLEDGRRLTLTDPEWTRLALAFGAPTMGDRDSWSGRRVRIADGAVWPATDSDSADSGRTGSAPTLF